VKEAVRNAFVIISYILLQHTSLWKVTVDYFMHMQV